VSVRLPALPAAADGLTIAQLSDFHLFPFTTRAFLQTAIARTRELKPDLIVLTGDYVLTHADSIFELAPLLAQLDAPLGVYGVLGNHDYWTNATLVRQGLREAGVTLLENQGVRLQRGRDLCYLAGVDDGWSGKPDLRAALDACPCQLPAIVLLHEPDFADRTAHDPRAAVQLSGHTHGGQVRLPGQGALVLPKHGRKYQQGLYRIGQLQLYTNRGLGVIGPPLRINCPPEITLLTLERTSG
jgi:predicted MPP superfamily phosphohydrolase